MSQYQLLLEPQLESNYINEENIQYSFLTERHLQVMWLEQKYFVNLKTVSGESIRVISPGIWNEEEGPDFKKAHLIIGDRDLFGDIEIHLSDEGWKQHEHHTDPNYNNVILHISLWNPTKKKAQILTSNQRSVEQTYLQDFMKIPHKRAIQLIDLDLYPYKKFCGTGRCSEQLFRTIPEKKIEVLFKDAAEWRLIKKKEHLHAKTDSPLECFTVGIALALGYKKNSEAFGDLFVHLKELADFPIDHLIARAMALFGFFSPYYLNYWNSSPYYQTLFKLSKSWDNQNKELLHLNLSSTRPLNHPIRRLVYLAYLIKNRLHFSDQNPFLDLWNQFWPTIKNQKERIAFCSQLISAIPTYEDTYWNSHYTFEQKPHTKTIPLLGLPIKYEILINTIFPILYEHITTCGTIKERTLFFDLYASLNNSQKSKKARYLQQRFFGNSIKGELLKKANLLQGAYQIHPTFLDLRLKKIELD